MCFNSCLINNTSLVLVFLLMLDIIYTLLCKTTPSEIFKSLFFFSDCMLVQSNMTCVWLQPSFLSLIHLKAAPQGAMRQLVNLNTDLTVSLHIHLSESVLPFTSGLRLWVRYHKERIQVSVLRLLCSPAGCTASLLFHRAAVNE